MFWHTSLGQKLWSVIQRFFFLSYKRMNIFKKVHCSLQQHRWEIHIFVYKKIGHEASTSALKVIASIGNGFLKMTLYKTFEITSHFQKYFSTNTILDKTGVINDLLGLAHSLASFHLKFVRFEKCVRKYRRTDNMCENNDHYRP